MKIKGWIFLVCFLTFSTSALAQTKPLLEVGEKMPTKWVKKTLSPADCFKTSAFDFDPFVRKVINNVEYLIAFDEFSHKITYVKTGDPDFKTSEGFRVGDFMELTKEQITKISGWEIHGPKTQDGWSPVIGYDRPSKKHETEDGFVLDEPGDPTIGFESTETIRVEIILFSRTRY